MLVFWAMFVATGIGQDVAGSLLVNVKASDLSPGLVATWPNNGTLGGGFTAVNDPSAVSGVGRTCQPVVRFQGDALWGPAAPAGITGNGDRTIEVWTSDPSPDYNEECMVDTARRWGPDGTHYCFIYADCNIVIGRQRDGWPAAPGGADTWGESKPEIPYLRSGTLLIVR